MRFRVEGPFEIERKPNRLGLFGGSFWSRVPASLRAACGCYVFAVRHGSNYVPWYIGKTERRCFEKECFQPAKANYYNDVLAGRKGTPVLFFIARRTKSGRAFSKPTINSYEDVDYLESMLIGIALDRNPELLNVRKTKLLKEMVVPGIINTPRSSPSRAESSLKICLGL